MSSPPLRIPPPPPLLPSNPPAHCHRCPDNSAEESLSPLQEILHAVRRLPQWRLEEDFNPEEKNIWLAVNNNVSPLIQDGPTCGLVVLKLAFHLLNKKGLEVCDLLREAREKKFTYQGEMFSAENVLDLATATSGCTGRVLSGGLEKHCKTILDTLQKAHPVLVPYDADPNHEPGYHQGHKAHWSLLTGYLMRLSSSEADTTEFKRAGFLSDQSCPQLLVAQPSPTMECASLHQRTSELFVFARQGKSRHLAVWSFDGLTRSNGNLREFSPSREAGDYLLPPGGVEEGLCGKAVMLLP